MADLLVLTKLPVETIKKEVSQGGKLIMKKLMLVFLALLLLVGCTPQGNDPEPTPTPTPAPVDTDPGLSQEELMGALSLEDMFAGPEGYAMFFTGKEYVSWFIQNSGYMRSGKITGFEYLKENRYKISATVPAFEGNDMDDPYPEYVVDFEMVYDPENKRFLEVKTEEFNGTFVASPIDAMHEVYVEDVAWTIYPDHHFVGKLFGSTHESFGHSYYLELSRDGKSINAANFEKGRIEHIYETTPASRLQVGRYYYCLVIREEILAKTGGNWVLVYDYKNDKTYTFDDVFCYFSVESGRYIMNIATQYNEVEDEGSSYIVPVYEQYEFTEKGLNKLN